MALKIIAIVITIILAVIVIMGLAAIVFFTFLLLGEKENEEIDNKKTSE